MACEMPAGVGGFISFHIRALPEYFTMVSAIISHLPQGKYFTAWILYIKSKLAIVCGKAPAVKELSSLSAGASFYSMIDCP